MNILYEVLNELNYCSQETFVFSCSFGDEIRNYNAMPFVSKEYPSQVYLVVRLAHFELATIPDSNFLFSLAKQFRKQFFHNSEMDKNTTLLLEVVNEDEKKQNLFTKIRIEDDPYYFKKYVFSYSTLEEKRANEYLQYQRKIVGEKFSYIREIQTYLLDAVTFSSYKENHINQPTYSYFAELVTKIPVFPLQIPTVKEIKSVPSFFKEELEKTHLQNVDALEQFFELKLDMKDVSVDTILENWNVIIE